MAEGHFYTIVIWEVRAGARASDLEELTRNGILPQYKEVPGVLSVKLFRIQEGEDVNKFMAMTIYESREAYNNWWAKGGQALLAWQQQNKAVVEKWVDTATPARRHNMTLLIDAEFPPGTPKINFTPEN
ncbi:antibiotic biosynthesis monooxygenase [Candidatus Chlorohelix sp.]|uniref:antibiotic biosynthesis monooxygenase n=1 Tax=Candidatus Chlorohelix sp. TaxID=3139201 RepID=UPI00306F52F1